MTSSRHDHGDHDPAKYEPGHVIIFTYCDIRENRFFELYGHECHGPECAQEHWDAIPTHQPPANDTPASYHTFLADRYVGDKLVDSKEVSQRHIVEMSGGHPISMIIDQGRRTEGAFTSSLKRRHAMRELRPFVVPVLMTDEQIAELCFVAQRAFVAAIGDPYPATEKFEADVRASMKHVVGLMRGKPDVTIETLHDIWLASQLDEGWTYGEDFDETKKRHPNMVPYQMLPEGERINHAIFTATVRQCFAMMQETSA